MPCAGGDRQIVAHAIHVGYGHMRCRDPDGSAFLYGEKRRLTRNGRIIDWIVEQLERGLGRRRRASGDAELETVEEPFRPAVNIFDDPGVHIRLSEGPEGSDR